MRFEQYYQHYLGLHQNNHCRRLHLLGMLVATAFAAACVWSSYYGLCLLAPLLVYPFAWTGHFFFEKNRPATWTNPIFAGLGDLRMTWDICRGKIKL